MTFSRCYVDLAQLAGRVRGGCFAVSSKAVESWVGIRAMLEVIETGQETPEFRCLQRDEEGPADKRRTAATA